MDDFLDDIKGPLIDLIRAATDWLNRELVESDEPEFVDPVPLFRVNDRGGIEPV